MKEYLFKVVACIALLSQVSGQVHAHGGGLYRAVEEGLWYWYGTTRKEQPGWISQGINLYSSADLQSWEFHGQMFDDSQIQDVGFEHPYRIERPKVCCQPCKQNHDSSQTL